VSIKAPCEGEEVRDFPLAKWDHKTLSDAFERKRLHAKLSPP